MASRIAAYSHQDQSAVGFNDCWCLAFTICCATRCNRHCDNRHCNKQFLCHVIFSLFIVSKQLPNPKHTNTLRNQCFDLVQQCHNGCKSIDVCHLINYSTIGSVPTKQFCKSSCRHSGRNGEVQLAIQAFASSSSSVPNTMTSVGMRTPNIFAL